MKSVLLAVAVIAGALVISARGNDPVEQVFHGWVEANLLFIGPDEIGRVEWLGVREGDRISAGAGLFTVDADTHRAAVQQAEAVLANAQLTFNRAQQLMRSGSGTKKEHDASQSALVEAEARLVSLQARLNRRSVTSPADGIVQRIYFHPGEVVAAGRPVVSLLPPGNVKLRFFVPQVMLPQIALGDNVRVRCDGCDSDIAADVTFISDTVEYTPPVIYSREERAKLVYLVEARPDRPDRLRVGQPARVILTKGGT